MLGSSRAVLSSAFPVPEVCTAGVFAVTDEGGSTVVFAVELAVAFGEDVIGGHVGNAPRINACASADEVDVFEGFVLRACAADNLSFCSVEVNFGESDFGPVGACEAACNGSCVLVDVAEFVVGVVCPLEGSVSLTVTGVTHDGVVVDYETVLGGFPKFGTEVEGVSVLIEAEHFGELLASYHAGPLFGEVAVADRGDAVVGTANASDVEGGVAIALQRH